MFSDYERKLMLQLARNAIQLHLESGRELTPPDNPFLQTPAGAFVTLHSGADLRGCIGYTEARHPLGMTLVKAAVSAAVSDPRFPPVILVELRRLSIDISVLSPFHRINGVKEIEVGKHGLMVQRGHHRGLLLPQVAVEQNWDAETFLGYTCYKAGLSQDDWKKNDVIIEAFTADVFAEDSSHH